MGRKIVHEELRCQSPEIIVRLLVECSTSAEIDGDSQGDQKGFRILDIAADNGIVGEQLMRQLEGRVRFLASCDILPAAKMAALRDRPAIHEEYVVADLADMDMKGVREVIGKDQAFDIITMCAALGFEPALLALLKVVQLRVRGLVATCVNELSLVNGQEGVWGNFIRGLAEEGSHVWSGMREVGRKEYLHRFDVTGARIEYMTVVFRKETASDGEVDRDLTKT